MKVLVTGHDGYIGCVLVPLLMEMGHDVVGLDAGFFRGVGFGSERPKPPREIWMDIRDVTEEQLSEFEAVIHLAAISNDPVGDLNAECTYEINYRATARLGEVARRAGVRRFLFSSSCSLYGASDDNLLTEAARFNPVTPYGRSKVLSEKALQTLATSTFTPTFLRNATAYGVSPRLRGDLVVNNLVAYAVTTGEVLIKSDGSPWRPLVHIQDISQAFAVLLEAPADLVSGEAFNVGRSSENYRVREVADLVQAAVPGSRVTYVPGGQPDARNYRVSCAKLETLLPAYRPTWTVSAGIEELAHAYRSNDLSVERLLGPDLMRIQTITDYIDAGRLDPASLRWSTAKGPTTQREPAA